MSAIRCKLLLCGQEAQTISKMPEILIDDIFKTNNSSKDSENALAGALILAQENYVKLVNSLLSELTDGS